MSAPLFNEFISVCFDGVQRRAARALELDASTVSRLCSGERGVTPDIAKRVETISGGRFPKEAFIWPVQVETKSERLSHR